MSRTTSPAGVRVHDLTVAYRQHPAVHHLSGEFAPGLLTAVVGPNGAGKSSLLLALAGGIRSISGRVDRPPALRVAYMPQVPELDLSFPLRVQEVVGMGLWQRIGSFRAMSDWDRDQVTLALSAVGLDGFESRLMGELSQGQVQRVLFARLLVQDAGLILLDEPFNAIDTRTTADLLQVLQHWRREARTVVAALHDLDQVREHFDQTLLLARELVAWGPTEQVLRSENLFKARQLAESWDTAGPVCVHGA